MRIDDAPARPTIIADAAALRRTASHRLGRSCLAIALGLVVALGGAARANPLTEAPGTRERLDEAGPAEAETRNPSATAIIRSLAPFADGIRDLPPARRRGRSAQTTAAFRPRRSGPYGRSHGVLRL